ncbi:hypothetical protein EG329_004904 [Mollisiaceae sp. DMI_Dod_QoI]|nr:hypothetical protein EG329_004904 [Helotiales sp. DMI_Dod_QoI]
MARRNIDEKTDRDIEQTANGDNENSGVLRRRSSPGQPADGENETKDSPTTPSNTGIPTPTSLDVEPSSETQNQEYPEGFARLAAFVSSSEEVLIFRGFKYLHTRVLHRLMIEITNLEAELAEIDKENESDLDANFVMDKEGKYSKREEKEDEVKEKLKEYDAIFSQFREMQAFGKAQERNHITYYNWMWSNKQIRIPNYDYIHQVDDFIPIEAERQSYNWLQGKDKKEKTTDERVRYYNEERIEVVVTFLLVSPVVGFLLIPALIFFLDPMSRAQMAITATVFILVCTYLMSVATQGNVYKVFVGASTYAAILTMFMGNFGFGNGSCSSAS